MHITLELPPVTKKNHSQIVWVKGKPLIIPSKQYKAYEKACGAFLAPLPYSMINYPINIKCTFYMPTKRRVDLVNLEEAVLDVLVKYGILQDDNSNIVVSMDGSRVEYDKEAPRTEIEITRIQK